MYVYTRYRSSCVATVKDERWLKRHSINYQVLSPQNIAEYHIKQMLRLADCTDGVILSRDAGQKTWEKVRITE